VSEPIAFKGVLWRWTGASGTGAWHFVTIKGAAGAALSETALMRRLEGMGRGFGALKVTARSGDTRWQTSVFPSREEGWMLPIKAAVRKAEELFEGQEVELALEL
jgi:hypothetical protein